MVFPRADLLEKNEKSHQFFNTASSTRTKESASQQESQITCTQWPPLSRTNPSPTNKKKKKCSIDHDRESPPPPANKATVSTGKPKQYYKNAKDLSLSHRLACLATIAAEQLDVLHGPGAVDHLAEHHVLVV